MSLDDNIREEIRKIFATQWKVRDGLVVPETDDVALCNDAVELDATVLYADLADSTRMVVEKKRQFGAEVYKAYLSGACQVIRSEGGGITAFDGDRVMAVFIGATKNTSAVKAALKISRAVAIVNEELASQYANETYRIRQAVGIDTSRLLVARTGVRGANDLVWVGRAANYAAKLAGFRDTSFTSWITADVYNALHDSARLSGKTDMWQLSNKKIGNVEVFASNYRWNKL